MSSADVRTYGRRTPDCINTGVLKSACGAPAQWKLTPDTTESYVQYAWNGWNIATVSVATPMALSVPPTAIRNVNVTYWEIDTRPGPPVPPPISQESRPLPRLCAPKPPNWACLSCWRRRRRKLRHELEPGRHQRCATLIDYISVHHTKGPTASKPALLRMTIS